MPVPIFIGMISSIFLAGCASVGPIPPILGPEMSGIFLFVLIGGVGYFIYHKLSIVSTRLDSLEKEIRKIKKQKERNKS